MSTYIKKDDAYNLAFKYGRFSMASIVDNLQSIEIVHCKDCKYRYDSLQCRMYSEGMETADNWFCADGERRDPCSSQDS